MDAIFAALDAARPERVVALSTIGAQAKQENLLTQLQYMERRLSALPIPVALLRAAWFIENAAGDIGAARDKGVIDSFLQPADRPVPMVATRDVAAEAARLMMQAASGPRVVELEGPTRVNPAEIARTLGQLLARDVSVEIVPRDSWEAAFPAQGMLNPTPRMRMLDGFNQGWIAFEGDSTVVRRGPTPLRDVLAALVPSHSERT